MRPLVQRIYVKHCPHDMYSLPVRDLIDQSKLVLAPPDMSVCEAARHMAMRGTGAVLIMADGRLVGIVTESDIVVRVVARNGDPRTTTLAHVMTGAPKTVDAGKSFGYAMLVMHENGFRHLPVVEGDVPIGLVSARNALDPDLEEFVSESRRREQIRREND